MSDHIEFNKCKFCGMINPAHTKDCVYYDLSEYYKPKAVLDSQVNGDHYKKLGDYQPWTVLSKWLTPEELRGFMKGTVIAYLAREKDKGGDVDLEKSLHTMQLFQELRTDK